VTGSSEEHRASADEEWQKEVLYEHRWGWDTCRADKELTRLTKLWEAAQPVSQAARRVAGQIVALEICNWNLEESILELCTAIGAERPAELAIGHMGSVSEDRWREVWGYHLALRDWLACEGTSGYAAVLGVCDPQARIRTHVWRLLGDRDELKELYVERLCLCLEFWLGGLLGRESAGKKGHAAAVSAVEQEIKKLDPEGQILGAMHLEGDGRLQPCHHKVFRRYDIIISSIGAGKWRAVMPMRGTDGLERAVLLESYLSPIGAWVAGSISGRASAGDDVGDRIPALLGERNAAKVFLSSLLVSLLRAQQAPARERAERRMKQS
jgi:hypothetical protein